MLERCGVVVGGSGKRRGRDRREWQRLQALEA
jgi:hypothetical protein